MGVTTVIIKSDGKEIDPRFDLLSVDVTREFNKIPVAELQFLDGDVPKQTFEILDGDVFEPGKKIEIALHEGDPKDGETVFTGIVVDQSLELNRSTGSTLTIELSDEAVKMTAVRKSVVHTNKKDSDIIKELIKQNKLKSGTVDSTKVRHAHMVQYYASDWDFMLSRAEANGLLVAANDGEVSVIQPEVKKPAVELELGIDNVLDFNLQVNGRHQYEKVSSVAWDIKKHELTQPNRGKGEEYVLSQGNYKIASIAQAVGGTETTLVHPVPMSDPQELQTWSTAQVTKSRLSLLRGWIKIDEVKAKIKVGETIELQGFGERFTGRNIISGVRHEITGGSWITHIQIGMDACWFSAQPKIIDTQAAGLLPGVNGLQIGIVQDQQGDPDDQFRVLVTIPAFGKGQEGVWARLASIDAGASGDGTGRGVFFRPEKGDEVIVGFLNDDPRQAVILGAMHSSSKNKTPVPVDAENTQKGIFTKSKYQLLFDEKNEAITLSTSDNNTICINEEKGFISLEDANENKVKLSKDGVTITSAKDCTITVEGNFAVEAKGNVEIKGKKVDLI